MPNALEYAMTRTTVINVVPAATYKIFFKYFLNNLRRKKTLPTIERTKKRKIKNATANWFSPQALGKNGSETIHMRMIEYIRMATPRSPHITFMMNVGFKYHVRTPKSGSVLKKR